MSTMKNINLKDMFDMLVKCILNREEEYPTFYYKRENIATGNPEYVEITEVDLMCGRFSTDDGDFSEFDWELDESNIYVEEEEESERINTYLQLMDKETNKTSKEINLKDIIYNQNEIEFEFGEYGTEEYETLPYKDFLFFKDKYKIILINKDKEI